MTDLLLIILLGTTIFLLFLFVWLRDAKISRKLKAYENAFEILNKNIFELEKRMTAVHQQQPTEADLKAIVAKELAPVTQSLVKALKELQESQLALAERSEMRISRLEEKLKGFLALQHDTPIDEKRIIALYKNGYTAEEIAKEMRLATGEVEFVLKLHEMK
ncbi:MAG: hypothetical protein K6347_07485 [Campylobacterales bacterium]